MSNTIYLVNGVVHHDYDEAIKDAKTYTLLTGRRATIKEYQLTNVFHIDKPE